MRSKRIVGLDLGDERVSVAQFRFTQKFLGGKVGVFLQEKGRHQQKWKVNRTDTKLFSEEEDKAQSIQKLFDDNNISRKRVVVSIGGADAIVKILSLPPLKPKEGIWVGKSGVALSLRETSTFPPVERSERKGDNRKKIEQIIQNEILTLFPLKTNEIAFDYQVLKRTKDQTLVLLAATRRDILENHLDLLYRAGISPKAIMPSSLLLYNTLVLSFPEIIEEGLVVAVRLKKSFADIVVTEDSFLKLARSFSLSVDEPHSFEREIRNTLSSYRNIKKVILMTESPKLPSFVKLDALKKTLSCDDCEVKNVDLESVTGLVAGYANMPNTLNINLLRQLIKEERQKQKKQTRQKIWKLAPIAILLFFITFSLILREWTVRANEKLTLERSLQQSFQKKKTELVRLEKKLNSLQSQESAINWAEPKYTPLSYRLYQIAKATPKEVWLAKIETPVEVNSRRKKKETIPFMSTLYVTGFSPSQQEINSFKDRLKQQDAFYIIKQESTEEVIFSGERVLQFIFVLKSKPLSEYEIAKIN